MQFRYILDARHAITMHASRGTVKASLYTPCRPFKAYCSSFDTAILKKFSLHFSYFRVQISISSILKMFKALLLSFTSFQSEEDKKSTLKIWVFMSVVYRISFHMVILLKTGQVEPHMCIKL